MTPATISGLARRRAALLGALAAALAVLLGRPAAASGPVAGSGHARPFRPASRPGSSGPGVPVQDPASGRTTILPPDEAAEAIRRYWTPERLKRARPTS
jgi:hypothetical protein